MKQPVEGYCLNPTCIESADGRFTFPVEHEIVCPKCGQDKWPYVGVLALIHWIRPAEKGPLLSPSGTRLEIACDPKRHYIATTTNAEAGTGHAAAVNCPGCLKELEKCHALGP